MIRATVIWLSTERARARERASERARETQKSNDGRFHFKASHPSFVVAVSTLHCLLARLTSKLLLSAG
eukprot:388381-Rhodomonas_salina.2